MGLEVSIYEGFDIERSEDHEVIPPPQPNLEISGLSRFF